LTRQLPSVVVAGAGVVGAALAARLAGLGCRVSLVDAGHPGAGTSGTTFGWVNANAKLPRAYFDLNVAGMEAHRRALDEGRAPWLRATGHLEWAAGDAARAALAARAERLGAWGYAVRQLSTREARELEPDLVLDGSAGDLTLYPDEGFAHPLVLLGHLLRESGEHGATLRTDARVVGFDIEGDRVCAAVLASGERLPADAVACCSGRWSGEVAALAGVALPLAPAELGSPAVGLIGVTSPVPAALSRVVSAPGLNLRPDGGGRLMLHAPDLDAGVSPETPPAPAAAEGALLLERARAVLRRLDGARLESLRVGVRPLPADGLSVAGWAPGVEGLYLLVTHSGITLAPVLGELAAREIAAGADEALLRPFRPGRFAVAAEDQRAEDQRAG
jgi:glycine/D-amino acid oxidase-like deaminating enzyme